MDASESEQTDLELLERWNAGDRQAAAELALRDADWIRARIRRERGEALAPLVETVDQLQDLVADVLTWRPRFVVSDRDQFRRLVARILANDLVDKARAAAVRPRPAAGGTFAESVLCLDARRAGPDTPPDSAAARNEDLAWLRLGMEFLGDEDRRLVQRHTFDGLGFVELEAEFDARANALRMRFNRVLVRLGGLVERMRRGELPENG